MVTRNVVNAPAIQGSAMIDELRREGTRTVPVLRRIRRKYSSALASAPPHQVLELAGQIVDTADPELRWVAYEIVYFHAPTRASLRRRDVERLGQGMGTWGEVDAFAYYVGGPAWRDGRISDATILRWAASSDRWWRRAALVSTIALTRRNAAPDDLARSSAVCESLVRDRDEMVVKALSWALREVGKQDQRAAALFVERHGATLPPRVVREVTNEIATGRKNPKRP
jgi:3-methyladenine DNA glycosylase AlkD